MSFCIFIALTSDYLRISFVQWYFTEITWHPHSCPFFHFILPLSSFTFLLHSSSFMKTLIFLIWYLFNRIFNRIFLIAIIFQIKISVINYMENGTFIEVIFVSYGIIWLSYITLFRSDTFISIIQSVFSIKHWSDLIWKTLRSTKTEKNLMIVITFLTKISFYFISIERIFSFSPTFSQKIWSMIKMINDQDEVSNFENNQ